MPEGLGLFYTPETIQSGNRAWSHDRYVVEIKITARLKDGCGPNGARSRGVESGQGVNGPLIYTPGPI